MKKDNKSIWKEYKEVIAITIVAFLLGVFYILVLFCNIGLSNDSIVLGFFGILTTFVVIGNYAQVSKIQNQMDRNINTIIDETKENSLASKINNLYDAWGQPRYESELKSQMGNALIDITKEYNKDLRVVFDFMLKNRHRDFMSNILEHKEVKCKVKIVGETNPKTARAKIEGTQIVFRNSIHRNIIEHIMELNGEEYDEVSFNRIIKWWLQYDSQIISPKAMDLIYGNGNSNNE